MATLQIRGADLSDTKRKAIEDAKKMQKHIVEECNKDGKEPPPYSLLELIGKGSYGRVYTANDIKANRVVAIKMIDIEEADTVNPKFADTYNEIMREINALKLLSNNGARNINQVLEAIPIQQSMWIITEYCAGGSVSTLMQPTAPYGLQEKWIIPILREVAEAIFWVHRQGIIHRDIKAANVLITEAGGVQLCDFGVAGFIETKFDKRTTVIGTPNWMAPELFDDSTSYGTEVDIWAFGSLAYEVASGLPPNALARLPFDQLGNLVKNQTPTLEGDYSEQLKDLVAYCLVDKPSQRPPIEAVQQHPYIFNTEGQYPSSSLALLVRAYKLWENRGGSRKSLFNPGGAQGLAAADADDLPSTALAADEWNFSTTMAFDQRVLDDTDPQAVYDVYGTNVDLPQEFTDDTARPSKFKGRRRPPPQLPVLKAPLEKVFDPNTISNYEDNSRMYYGRPMPPPAPPSSDLPLRDDSQHLAVRESLIDLDASLHGGDLSSFADMDTIRAPGGHDSTDYSFDDSMDFNKAPLSDPADLSNNRKTQDWKFPSMQGAPLSANPEMSRFSFNEAFSFNNTEERSRASFNEGFSFSNTEERPRASFNQGFSFSNKEERSHTSFDDGFSFPDDENETPGPSPIRPALLHHPTDPSALQSQSYADLAVPRVPDNRISMSSLIDLDESLPDTIPELTRPSTANSDAASVTGSDIGAPNPFEFERHASIYKPLAPNSTREPSIYVSDDSDFARKVSDAASTSMPNLSLNGGSGASSDGGSERRGRPDSFDGASDAASLYTAGDYQDSEYISMGDRRMRDQYGDIDQFPQDDDLQQRQRMQQTQRPLYQQQQPPPPPPQPQRELEAYQDANMPPLPNPPSARVMQGVGSRQEVSDELQRMLASFQEHLSFTHAHLASLPIRRHGGGRLEPPAVE